MPNSLSRRLLVAAFLPGLLAVALFAALNPKEPKFQGRGFKSWLDQYHANIIAGGDSNRMAMRESAKTAIRSIGTNAIPERLKLLTKTDSKAKTELVSLLNRQRFLKLRWRPASFSNNQGAVGFQALGAGAKEAVPLLVNIYERNLSQASRSAVGEALGAIGPDAAAAIPSLLRGAMNTNYASRVYAIDALGQIHFRPEMVVPALLQCLTNDPEVHVITVRALSQFKSDGH